MPGGQKGPGEVELDMEGVGGGDLAELIAKDPEGAMKALEKSGTGLTLAADGRGRLVLPENPGAALEGVTEVIRGRMERRQPENDPTNAPVEVPEDALERIEAALERVEAQVPPAASQEGPYNVEGKPGTGQTVDFFKAGDAGTYPGGPNDPARPKEEEEDPFA